MENKYCKFCNNKLFDRDKGLLCGLTNSKPKSFISCSDYSENIEERDKYRKGSGIYRMRDEELISYYFPFVLKKELDKLNFSRIEIKKSVFKSILFAFFVPYTFSFIYWNFTNPVEWTPSRILFNLIYLIMLLILIIRFFTNKPVIVFDKSELKISDQTYKWNGILRIYFSEKLNIGKYSSRWKRFKETLMIVETFNAKHSYDISRLNTNRKKMLKYIEYFRKSNNA